MAMRYALLVTLLFFVLLTVPLAKAQKGTAPEESPAKAPKPSPGPSPVGRNTSAPRLAPAPSKTKPPSKAPPPKRTKAPPPFVSQGLNFISAASTSAPYTLPSLLLASAAFVVLVG